MDEMMPYARSKQQRIHISIPENFYIQGHHDSLAIMLRNFIDNAIKYTPSGGDIDIILTPDGKLTISDNGTGMTPEQKKQAFDRFSRFDKSGQIGSGLGLSIAEWIAKNHDLNIELLDNQPQGFPPAIFFVRRF